MRAFKATETVETPDGDYTLSINIEVIDAIEDDFDTDFESAVELVGKGRLGKIARFLRGLLLQHHPNVTLDDAFTLARAHGTAFNEAMARLLEKARPEQAEASGDGENPPNAHRGTGENSSSRGAPQGSRRVSSGSKRREHCS
jgi:hypothetical protein